ncbi:uncharacterized protein LOC121861719 [Homarus americanus]|uniref:Uncharacterized protein n=1 Tax=Homarus americanus TaxID=6706 RepID=A0A8J5N3G6_HOMAM|nr:uncharacterized protein LOC121861719 [Homarus americanus]KAG7172505.1 hypothetical protein Hamer_G022711 [Homarus americanus]
MDAMEEYSEAGLGNQRWARYKWVDVFLYTLLHEYILPWLVGLLMLIPTIKVTINKSRNEEMNRRREAAEGGRRCVKPSPSPFYTTATNASQGTRIEARLPRTYPYTTLLPESRRGANNPQVTSSEHL